MRPIVTSLILSLFLSIGTNVAFADRHRDHRDRDRQEQRDRNHRSDRHYGNSVARPGDRGEKRHKDKYIDRRHDNRKHDKRYRPVNGYRPAPPPQHYRPVPPPPPRRYGPVPPPPPPRLAPMVRYATIGCRDVDVWQIDYDTYIVRYRRGNRFYTQRIYPYRDVYGPRNTISVNWTPSDPWVAVPSIHLNINL